MRQIVIGDRVTANPDADAASADGACPSYANGVWRSRLALESAEMPPTVSTEPALVQAIVAGGAMPSSRRGSQLSPHAGSAPVPSRRQG